MGRDIGYGKPRPPGARGEVSAEEMAAYVPTEEDYSRRYKARRLSIGKNFLLLFPDLACFVLALATLPFFWRFGLMCYYQYREWCVDRCESVLPWLRKGGMIVAMSLSNFLFHTHSRPLSRPHTHAHTHTHTYTHTHTGCRCGRATTSGTNARLLRSSL